MAGSAGHNGSVNHDAAALARSLCDSEGRTTVHAALYKTPGAFAFAQAVDLAIKELRFRGLTAPEKALRFKVNPNLSFPPGDIETLELSGQEEQSRAEMTLNLMGLHGAGSPVPAYITEYVAQHQDEPDALRDFLDIFNHRLIGLLYDAWQKYRYYLSYEENASDRLSARFFSFIGMGLNELRKAHPLQWSRLLAYSGLVAFKSDAAGSLERILRHYFSLREITIVPCIERTVNIHEDQQNRLGVSHSFLAQDCILGETIQDQTGKFRILLSNLSWERFTSFLPDAQNFTDLRMLVTTVLRSRLYFEIELRLRPEEIPPLHIGQEAITRLGWSTWLGENGNGIVNLEPAQEVRPCST